MCLCLEPSCHLSQLPQLFSNCTPKFFLKLLPLICYKLEKWTAKLLELDVNEEKKVLSKGLRDSPMNKVFSGLTHLLVHLLPASQLPITVSTACTPGLTNPFLTKQSAWFPKNAKLILSHTPSIPPHLEPFSGFSLPSHEAQAPWWAFKALPDLPSPPSPSTTSRPLSTSPHHPSSSYRFILTPSSRKLPWPSEQSHAQNIGLWPHLLPHLNIEPEIITA